MALHTMTKIVATVGPASRSMSGVRSMIRAGADVIRINGSYEDAARHAHTIKTIRDAARREHAPTAVLIDLPGPKFRLGELSPTQIILKAGAEVVLNCGTMTQHGPLIPVPDARIATALKPGGIIFINDGIVELVVLKNKGRQIHCRVKNGGPIRSGKGINLPRARLALPALTPRDRELATMAARMDVDYVGLSFVRSAQNIKDLRRLLKRLRATHIGIIAKIEKPEALDDLDNIIDASDAIMVARGDLGIETPYDQLPLIQKRILARCRIAGKPSITATQMLESMVGAMRPTRAEATDVANAVWEGTDAVMLSEETSIGIDPANAVRAMARIAREAEHETPPLDFPAPCGDAQQRQALGISRAAGILARELGARAIVTPTRSGRTALYMSRSHQTTCILAPTGDERTARRMSLYRSVVPMPMKSFADVDGLLSAAEAAARRSRLLRTGDTIVITSGAHGSADDITRLIEVRQI